MKLLPAPPKPKGLLSASKIDKDVIKWWEEYLSYLKLENLLKEAFIHETHSCYCSVCVTPYTTQYVNIDMKTF